MNGTTLQLANTNSTGGINASGLGINVPAGRAPIKVNANAGKATNLNADKLDGLDQSAFAHGSNVTVVANRVVTGTGTGGSLLLALPGMGELTVSCPQGFDNATIYWRNTSSVAIDAWLSGPTQIHASVVPPHDPNYRAVATWTSGAMNGGQLFLGQGNDPAPRQTASVVVEAYRSVSNAPCGFQAMATTWKTA